MMRARDGTVWSALAPRGWLALAPRGWLALAPRGWFDGVDWLLAGGAGLLFAIVFAFPVLARLGDFGLHGDWDLFWQLHFAGHESVLEFGQFPLWNPYRCGGMPLFADPQTSILTPFFLLELAAGPVIGVQLAVVLHLAIAWSGGYILGRTLSLSRAGAAATASTFAASSWFSLHVAGGHLWILPAAYLPVVAAALWMSIDRGTVLPAVIAGLFAAMTWLEGGPYLTSQAGLLGVFIATTASVYARRFQPLSALLVFAAFAFGFAAVKLLPSWQFLSTHPRPMDFHEWNGAWTMLTALLSRNQDYRRDVADLSVRYDFIEYGAYVGVVGAALAILGLLVPGRRKAPWIVAACAFLLLAVGDAGVWFSPAGLLHLLPPFSSQRVPSRFLVPAVLAIGVLAGIGVDALQRRFGRAGLAVSLFLIGVHLADAWFVGRRNYEYMFEGTQPLLAAAPSFQQHRNPGVRETVSRFWAHQGAIACSDTVMTATPSRVVGINEPGYRGEQYLDGPGTVTLASWSPNELVYEVDTTTVEMLTVNQNYDPAWKLRRGAGKVDWNDGLIGVRLAAGHQTLALRYQLPLWGGVITAVTSVVAIVLGWRAVRRRAFPVVDRPREENTIAP